MKRKLRIGMIAPMAERVPPKKYGGTERVIYNLVEELVKKGHKVTLFASGDSKTSADLVSIFPRSLREANIRTPYFYNKITNLNIKNAFKRQDEFDIIHDHNSTIGLASTELSKVPTVATLHGQITPENSDSFEKVKKTKLVTISKHQTALFPKIKPARVIYNGLNMKEFPFSEKFKKYMIFVGRIALDKGVHFAIDVAQSLNIPLLIAAKLDQMDKAYYKEFVEPKLSNGMVNILGEVNQEKRNKLMRDAYCFLHPVVFNEPFGLTLIESMACGTPVVAFDKGSIPEIIQNGKTGFVVKNTTQMINAVENIGLTDRLYCREYALENFNSKLMADKYEELYYNIL